MAARDGPDPGTWSRVAATRFDGAPVLTVVDVPDDKRGDERIRKLVDGVIALVGVLSTSGFLPEANEPAVAAAAGTLVRYDAQSRIGGDGRLWIDFQLVPVPDAEGRVAGIIPSGVDITERKQAGAHREPPAREAQPPGREHAGRHPVHGGPDASRVGLAKRVPRV